MIRPTAKLLQFLAKWDYVLVLHPWDWAHASREGFHDTFDMNTRRELLRIGLMGTLLGSSIYICRHVPPGVVVRLHGLQWTTPDAKDNPTLQTIAATWPDIPDDLLPCVFPKPHKPLPERSRKLLLDLVDEPEYVHRRVIALGPLLERKLIERVGPSSYRATEKGRLVTGKYRTAWSLLDNGV